MNGTSPPLLVLYTGGTIGMQAGADGLAPAGGFEARLRERQAQERDRRLPPWRFAELAPPIDSANMTPRHWLRLRELIVAEAQQGCPGVLVLQGTDTLAYSCAALAFLLLGLPIPVLFTGAMRPAGAPGSDAWSNLFGALQALHDGVAAGVHLYFHGALLPATRVSKLRSDAFDAFQVLPRTRRGQRAGAVPAALDYRVPRREVNLAVLPLFPGLRADHLRGLLGSGVQGLVLECYGAGTGPSDDAELLAVLREARARGVVLAAISQCLLGHIEFDAYAAGSQLARAGLVSGGGMTREAALGKLFALLGAGLPPAAVEHWFALDLCGERAD